jgi:hypothetical protein
VLRYGGLVATDARGRLLRSWLELHGRRIVIAVSDRGAAYPLRIDPMIQQGSKVVAPLSETGEGNFGASVALSEDGDTALVGGPDDDGGVGATWVFTLQGSTWTHRVRS